MASARNGDSGAFALRAEYEKFDTDVVGDLDLISVGFTYTFGSH